MSAYINFDGLFIKNISFVNNSLFINIFFMNTGNSPAYDVSLIDSPFPLPPVLPDRLPYLLQSYIKYPFPAVRNYVNIGGNSCGMNIGKVDPGELVEVTIQIVNLEQPLEPSADVAVVRYTDSGKQRYGKSNIAVLQ